MSDSGLPLLRLYVFCGVCALLAAAYGVLAIDPSPGMLLTIRSGPAVGVAAWLTADARRTRALVAQDAGLFFYMTWPLTIWWYARQSGAAGLATGGTALHLRSQEYWACRSVNCWLTWYGVERDRRPKNGYTEEAIWRVYSGFF